MSLPFASSPAVVRSRSRQSLRFPEFRCFLPSTKYRIAPIPAACYSIAPHRILKTPHPRHGQIPVYSPTPQLGTPPRASTYRLPQLQQLPRSQTRHFHDYFVTHLPSSSLHPDSRTAANPRHNLPRADSEPHSPQTVGARSPASMVGISRDTTVVRIPLKSAKHHFGAHSSRGSRPYNEDTYQAGTIGLPAFAKRAPLSVRAGAGEITPGGSSTSGDPQVFYFGIFDGHGGDVCSTWLREKLHSYVELAADKFGMESSLQNVDEPSRKAKSPSASRGEVDVAEKAEANTGADEAQRDKNNDTGSSASSSADSDPPEREEQDPSDALQRSLIEAWSETVGGYFLRFKPEYFSPAIGGQGQVLTASVVRNNMLEVPPLSSSGDTALDYSGSSLESIMSYAFLQADLDFVTGQNPVSPPPPSKSDKSASHTSTTSSSTANPHGHYPTPTSESHHSHPPSSSSSPPSDQPQPFIGGSTSSVALISTPTAIPFWHPSTPFTIATAHLGDTRILLCSTTTGNAVPLTATHHPSDPAEATRLRRYAAAFTTDSFGEERISGLANTRAFGDRRSKRVGVSAEPQLALLHARPAEFSFMVLASDGVTGVLSDTEIVDTVKECRNPAEAAQRVASLAAEIGAGESGDADNATVIVVRMGGWERRDEGGGGSVRSREGREDRRREAGSGRGGRGR